MFEDVSGLWNACKTPLGQEKESSHRRTGQTAVRVAVKTPTEGGSDYPIGHQHKVTNVVHFPSTSSCCPHLIKKQYDTQ